MRKRAIRVLSFLTAVVLLTGCGLKEKTQEIIEQVENKEEVSYAIDRARYKEYAKVLDDIIDDNEWPDGTNVSEEWNPYFGQDNFAICDIDMDGAEELLVEITNTCVAGMIIQVFDYDAKADEVVEQYCGFPGVEFYDNGILYEPWSHNQGGAEIHPFEVYRYNEQDDSYESVTSIETQAAYDEWEEKEMKNARSIYIPWESIWEPNVERIEHLSKVEGAIKPTRINTQQKITQFDINGNEKRDRIEIRMDEQDDFFNEPGYGSKWSVLINDKVVISISAEGGAWLDVYFYQVSPRRTYLSIEQGGCYDGVVLDMDLYQFQDGELIEQLDCYKTVTDNSDGAYPEARVSYLTKDKLQVEAISELKATAGIKWYMDYEYNKKTGKWEMTSEEFPIVEWFYNNDSKHRCTATLSFDVYKSYDSNELAFKVRVGEKVYLDSIRYYNGKTYFKARNEQGQEGWFVDPEDFGVEVNGDWIYGYFEETQFTR